ncbi:thioredoxin domain-containing protein [Oceanimonas sp. GK1]|uniref:tetratricopeptide repeat protein n=1 Tax=Oceanimonas sp. (strain GK1 / IBRC-M 10197) TaxID=511062 RepID=UPI0002495422|nr:tetratricopeptide repeat protein [Oceanimonas sp. GK1]AEY01040.1 thioredoxin domain-containing protein [Oceanimonas sp. GK1]
MIVDITVENFQQALIQASMDKTVVIFFHADQVPECQPMSAQLERLIGADNGHVDLARVDVADPQLQSLAVQLGLQALPALVAFKGGQPVDILEGPQDEAALKGFLQPYQPNQAELLLDQAKQMLGLDPQAAYDLLQQARALDDTPAIRLTLAETALALNKLEETRQLLDTIGMADQDAQYQHVLARLELAQEAADSPELRELEQRLAAAPEDLGLKEELAVQYFQAGRQEEALQLLTEILQKDLSFGDARKHLLDMLTSMGADPVASRYRRKLYSMLY